MSKKKPNPQKPWAKQQGVPFPEEIKELGKLRTYLCTEAHVPRTATVNVEACRKCRLCAYGREYVKRWDALKQKEKETEEMAATKKPVDETTLQEQLEQERKRCEEINKINTELASTVQTMEKQLEDAQHKAAEDHVEIQGLRLDVIRLKAKIFDVEHSDF